MRIAELVMAVVLALLSLAIMYKAGEAPWGAERFSNIGFNDSGAPAGGFWPFWVAAIMLVCSIWVFINGLLKNNAVARSTEPYLDAYGVRILLMVGVPVFLLVFMTEIISIYFSMALFLFYYMMVLGKHGLLLSTAMALVIPFWMYLFFDITMTTTLPKGALFLEDNIYSPLGTWFRGISGAIVGIFFLVGGVVLVSAALLSAKRQNPGQEG